MASFGDLAARATSVLEDDFHTEGFQLTGKKDVSFAPGSASSHEYTVDLGGKTATGFSFSLPKPQFVFGTRIPGAFNISLDKDGATGFEASFDDETHKVAGLEVGLKGESSGFAIPGDFTLTSSYNVAGMDTQLNFETTLGAPQDFVLECVKKQGAFTVGAKLDMGNGTTPDVGLSTDQGKFFAALTAEEGLSKFTGHATYAVSDDLQVAASGSQASKTGEMEINLAAAARVNQDLSVKAKFENFSSFSVAFTKALATGTALNGGFSYNLEKGDMSYGAKVCIE